MHKLILIFIGHTDFVGTFSDVVAHFLFPFYVFLDVLKKQKLSSESGLVIDYFYGDNLHVMSKPVFWEK